MKFIDKTRIAGLLCIIPALFFSPLQGQQNNRINPRVEVERNYEISILERGKPKLSSTIPDSISQFNISMDYAIFDKPYLGLYSFTPLPSVRLMTPKTVKQPWMYLRLGLMWQTTPEADLFIQAPLSGMSALLLTAQHRSFWGELPLFHRQNGNAIADQMLNNTEARYSINWDKGRFEIGGGYQYNHHTYYGISEPFPTANLSSRSFMRNNMSHNYGLYKADLSLSSLKTLRPGTVWNFAFGWSLLEDQARLWPITSIPVTRENLIHFKGEVGVRFEQEQMFGLSLYGSFSNQLASSELDRGIFAFNPYYRIDKERFNFMAGLIISGAHNYEPDSEKMNKFFIYPKIEASFHIFHSYLSIYANVFGENRHNNYQSLLSENPWLFAQNLDLRSSDIPWDIMAGFKGKVFKHFGFNLYGRYLKTNNQYFFRNTSYPPYAFGCSSLSTENLYLNNLFTLYYDNEERLSAVAELSWNSAPLTLNLTGKYHSYTLNSGTTPYFKPNIEIYFSTRYQWRERIIATANILYRGDVYAQLEPNYNPISSFAPVFSEEKIDGFTDIGLTLEYRFASWFGVFVEGKNLLNADKQYYLLYREPGMRIGGGVTFRF